MLRLKSHMLLDLKELGDVLEFILPSKQSKSARGYRLGRVRLDLATKSGLAETGVFP